MRRSLSENTLQISTDAHHLQTRTTQCRDLLSLRLDTYLRDNSGAQCTFSHNIQHQCRKGKPHIIYLKLVSHWAWTCISCKQSKCNVWPHCKTVMSFTESNRYCTMKWAYKSTNNSRLSNKRFMDEQNPIWIDLNTIHRRLSLKNITKEITKVCRAWKSANIQRCYFSPEIGAQEEHLKAHRAGLVHRLLNTRVQGNRVAEACNQHINTLRGAGSYFCHQSMKTIQCPCHIFHFVLHRSSIIQIC
jgi:hypothetical protein